MPPKRFLLCSKKTSTNKNARISNNTATTNNVDGSETDEASEIDEASETESMEFVPYSNTTTITFKHTPQITDDASETKSVDSFNDTFEQCHALQDDGKSHKQIYDWTVKEGQSDLLPNLLYVISNDMIRPGNIVVPSSCKAWHCSKVSLK